MVATALASGLAPIALADEGPADKSGYNLFNPTPTELMRPLSADRPDGTESPITVDAGHVQVELSFLAYTHDDESSEHVDAWTVFDTNLKLGLLNNVDVQFVFGTYSEEEVDPRGAPSETLRGFGDVQVRVKINLWGNDGGNTAFGIMPFLKIPTNTELSNQHGEGGVIFMLGWDVAETWGLGFQAEVDFVYDEDDDDYDTELAHTVVLGFDVLGPVGAYIEYIGVASSDTDSDYQAIFSSGLTYEVNENMVLDVGTQAGLSNTADDVTVFAGVTRRF